MLLQQQQRTLSNERNARYDHRRSDHSLRVSDTRNADLLDVVCRQWRAVLVLRAALNSSGNRKRIRRWPRIRRCPGRPAVKRKIGTDGDSERRIGHLRPIQRQLESGDPNWNSGGSEVVCAVRISALWQHNGR